MSFEENLSYIPKSVSETQSRTYGFSLVQSESEIAEKFRQKRLALSKSLPFIDFKKISSCPFGFEPLSNEKNFFFEQRLIGDVEKGNAARYSYNIYVSNGTKIYLVVSTMALTGTDSLQYFNYDVLALGISKRPIFTIFGDDFGGFLDVCFCCCVCKPSRGVIVNFGSVKIGEIRPMSNSSMPIACSWNKKQFLNCESYIDKYVVNYLDFETGEFKSLKTRRPKGVHSGNGLEIVEGKNSLVGRISNCNGKRLGRIDGRVYFALSLSDSYIKMHPHVKALLVALTIMHV